MQKTIGYIRDFAHLNNRNKIVSNALKDIEETCDAILSDEKHDTFLDTALNEGDGTYKP
jgi:hypothetical protein